VPSRLERFQTRTWVVAAVVQVSPEREREIPARRLVVQEFDEVASVGDQAGQRLDIIDS
jgi:hypothetical protein